MAKIVVTGHAGFIGFHAARAYLDSGHTVLGIDSLTDYYDPQLKQDRLRALESSPRLTNERIALEDRDSVVGAIKDFQPDVIIHLAAQAGVRYSLENPDVYISSNVLGTHAILEAARVTMPSHLMIASTSSVYGGNRVRPSSESHKTDAPMSLYASTKIAAEAMAHSYAHLWKIPTTCFRFFTVYGPWGRPDMALFKFVNAIDNNEPIDIYGFGEMRRDFTYIDDLIAAIRGLSMSPPRESQKIGDNDSLSPVAPFRTVNIAGASPIDLMDFVGAVEDAMGRTAQKRMLPMQPGDVVATSADASLLKDLIGEIPKTPVSDGVAAFVDWHKQYRKARSLVHG
jgi:UDP-glucuronate 4-epimerase